MSDDKQRATATLEDAVWNAMERAEMTRDEIEEIVDAAIQDFEAFTNL